MSLSAANAVSPTNATLRHSSAAIGERQGPAQHANVSEWDRRNLRIRRSESADERDLRRWSDPAWHTGRTKSVPSFLRPFVRQRIKELRQLVQDCALLCQEEVMTGARPPDHSRGRHTTLERACLAL